MERIIKLIKDKIAEKFNGWLTIRIKFTEEQNIN